MSLLPSRRGGSASIAVLVAVACASTFAGLSMSASASGSAPTAAVRSVLLQFVQAAYAHDGKRVCAITTPSERQALIAQAGFSGAETYTAPCAVGLTQLYRVFVQSRPLRTLAQIEGEWRAAPISAHGDVATARVVPLAAGAPFPKSPAEVTLAFLRHRGHWLLAVACSRISACNRFPVPSDVPAIRAAARIWELANAGYDRASGTALCADLTAAFRKEIVAQFARFAGHPVSCAGAVTTALANPSPDFHKYPLARIDADIHAEVIHDRGNDATVTMRNADFGGSANWQFEWHAGRWLLATFDG